MTQPSGETRGRAPGSVVWTELFRASRFGVVGLIATCIHILAVFTLIDTAKLPVLLANLIAFLGAFGFSFAGHYYWTFRCPGSATSAMWRFLLISLIAFSANTLLLVSLLKAQWPSPAVRAMLAAAVMPAVTFLGSRLWAFREDRKGSRKSRTYKP